MDLPRLLIFASGTKDGGGSGFKELVENTITGILQANIVGVVSNHKQGGVFKIAKHYSIPFCHMKKPYTEESYQAIVNGFQAEWVALSGWLKLVEGLNPKTTINIHPGPLPDFGGSGLYGHHVHEAVIKAYQRKALATSAVCMHFVTQEYDQGPIFFYFPVLIRDDDTPETLATRVNKIEHGWQSWVTNLVVHQQIRLEGNKVVVPDWYPFLKNNDPQI